MSASIAGMRLPLRLPEWMGSWPEGVRPRIAYATGEGVELLLVRAGGGWALVQCRVGRAGVEARTLDIDASLADRAELVARAFESALRRSGSAALRWLRAAPRALARIRGGEGIEGVGAASATELLELLEERLEDPDALVDLSVRSESPIVAAAALQRLVAMGELQAALGLWARFGEALVAAAQAEPSLLACATMLEALRGDGVAATALVAGLGERACDPVTHEAAAALWIALRDPAAATDHLLARARMDPSVGAWEYLIATAGLARDGARVVEAVARARELGSDKRRAQVQAMLHAGAFEAAEVALREELGENSGEGLDEDPDRCEWRVELAKLLLRRVELDEADALAVEVLDRGAELADAHVIRGGVAVLRGAADEALAHLDRALALEPEHQEGLLWRAQARLESGAAADPPASTFVLGHRANEDLFGAPFDDTALWQLLFALVRSHIDAGVALHGPLAYFHRALLRDLHPAQIHARALASDEGTLALLWQSLARFGGSRCAPFSMLDGPPGQAKLVLADELASTQVQATRWQHRLLTTPVEQVIASFAALAERYPDSPHPHTYTAEIELWRGDYETAWRLTDDMWQRTGTRWSYIGSGAALGLLGRYEEALERWQTGGQRFEGFLGHEATYCHRGEVYRLMGRLDEARADLDQATGASPTRVGAWINLALVMLAAGDEAEAVEGVLEQIDGYAPILLWEATRAAGLEPAIRVDRGQPRAVLEQALHLMRGNRSSVMHTFVDDGGRLRVMPDEHLEIWRQVASRLAALPQHGLGAWMLERALASE